MKCKVWTQLPSERSRTYVLLLLIFSAMLAAGGYWFLNGKVIAGEKKFDAGQQKLLNAKPVMKRGKADLQSGKERLSEGKRNYRDAKNNLLLVWTDKLLTGGRGFKKARGRITDGEQRIADGEEKISTGEDRIDAGRKKLRWGGVLLLLARAARIACAAGAFIFATVVIVLGLRWRHIQRHGSPKR